MNIGSAWRRKSTSGKPEGRRWAVPDKIAELKILDMGLSGPHPAPAGRHIEWDSLYAIVSPRSVSAGPNRA
jgi:hypothetical protein